MVMIVIPIFIVIIIGIKLTYAVIDFIIIIIGINTSMKSGIEIDLVKLEELVFGLNYTIQEVASYLKLSYSRAAEILRVSGITGRKRLFNESTTRVCKHCKVTKTVIDFEIVNKKGRRRWMCKTCRGLYVKLNRLNKKELKKTEGITDSKIVISTGR